MSAHDHPYYEHIQQHLAEAVAYIDKELKSLDPPISYGGDRYAQRQLQRQNLEKIEQFKESRQEAYTARIDWEDATDGSDTFYIGKFAMPDRQIYSWASPLGERLYFDPGHPHKDGVVRLILNLGVRGHQLQSIHNQYVDPQLEGPLLRAQFTDSLLFQLLQDSHSRLRDIVATIQEQQYRIIKSPMDQLLVVQGAPGSGKTSVALHRIAYLLHNHRSLTADKMLVLGPNQTFLSHVSAILPSLGQRRVPQKTFDAWTTELLGKLDYESQEESLEALLNLQLTPAEKALRYRNARNKGSLNMAHLLDQYVEQMYAAVLDSKTEALRYSLRLRNASVPDGALVAGVARSIEELRVLFERVRDLPLNQRRAAIEERLVRDLVAELRDSLSDQLGNQQLAAEILHEQQVKTIREAVQRHVHTYFTDWESANVSIAYRRLLRTPDLLRTCGEGLFSDWDLELLAQDAPTARTLFRFSDLAALMYLKLCLDGPSAAYEHIVVDEAQDMTPLHFHVLQRYSRGASMTVLGDLEQGIYPHHGIATWEELAEAIGAASIVPEFLQKSYRSTRQIIDFANALLDRVGTSQQQRAEPVKRPGPAPSLAHFRQRDDLVEHIARTVSKERERWPAIAIVCKTATACRLLAEDLKHSGLVDCQLLIDRNAEYGGQTAIIPAYLTKGLEFDVVIVADADAETYPSDLLHQRLLYVALTRAAHVLHIRWTGALTPLLDNQHPVVPLQPILGDVLTPRLITIADYAGQQPGRRVDRCVERLARTERLWLLQRGKIDAVVLDVILSTLMRAPDVAEEDVAIVPLDEAAQTTLRQQVADLVTTPDPLLQEALALIEMTYGLLRNQLRAVGLAIADEGIVPLDEQVILLATLLDAIRANKVALTAGRWTTRQSVLQAISTERRSWAEGLLTTLITHGQIEQPTTSRRAELRLSLAAVTPLLALALGYSADAWDQDVIAAITYLPEPLDWNASLALR
jgi:DNA helicase II / ATP-dependent DNA helicase PcrA